MRALRFLAFTIALIIVMKAVASRSRRLGNRFHDDNQGNGEGEEA